MVATRAVAVITPPPCHGIKMRYVNPQRRAGDSHDR